MFAQTASPKTYFTEQILTFALSALCLVVDAWAVYHTVNGAYRITSTPRIAMAYVWALGLAEISVAFAALYLLRFSFSTRPLDLPPA
jgi:hypothetical protein